MPYLAILLLLGGGFCLFWWAVYFRKRVTITVREKAKTQGMVAVLSPTPYVEGVQAWCFTLTDEYGQSYDVTEGTYEQAVVGETMTLRQWVDLWRSTAEELRARHWMEAWDRMMYRDR